MIDNELARNAGVRSSAVANGFKVDPYRGEQIGRVSSEWFSRPDDERYLSLGALHEAVRGRAERATARTVETRAIRVEVRVESGGSAHAVSRAGAMGCMQIMPATWSEVRARYRLGTDALDTRDNVLAGAAYLREMIDRYDWPGALAAYNAGPSRYVDFLVGSRALPPETRDYVTQIAGVLHEDGTQPHLEQAIEPRPRWTDAPIFVAANNTPNSPLALRSNGHLDTSARATDRTSAIHTLYPQPANGQLFAVHRQ